MWALHDLCGYSQLSDGNPQILFSGNSDGCHHNHYPKGHSKHKPISVHAGVPLLLHISLHARAAQTAATSWAVRYPAGWGNPG